jgi:hypothetical protein
MAATSLPAMAGARYLSFRDSLPNMSMAGVAMFVWTMIAVGTPHPWTWPSSSMNTVSYQ